MKLTYHSLDRFNERAVIDFLDNNPIYRNKMILQDIIKHFPGIKANTKGTFMIEGKYCKYILRNDFIITCYKKKKYMYKSEKRAINKQNRNEGFGYNEIDKKYFPNIKKLFDFTKLELIKYE